MLSINSRVVIYNFTLLKIHMVQIASVNNIWYYYVIQYSNLNKHLK
jgi:hypothetical protein